jgi:tetratricopeptide (TPR) repeat protein
VLEKLSLLDKKYDRFYMLPLTKTLSGHEFESIGDVKQTFTKRWIDYYTNFVKERQETNKNNLTQISLEYENIEQVINWLSNSNPNPQKLIEIIRSVQPFLLSKGYWTNWEAWLLKAKEVALFQNDELVLGYVFYGLGLINVLRREPIHAREFLERASHIFRNHQKTPELLRTEIDISRVCMFEGKYDEASKIILSIEELVNELSLPELSIFIRIRKSELLTELGVLDREAGDTVKSITKFKESKTCLLEALKIQGERESTYGLNFIYWRLGVVLIEENNFEEAKEYLLRSLDVAIELEMANGVAHATGWLSVLNERCNNLTEAKNLAHDAKQKFLNLKMISHAKEMEKLINRISKKET